MPLHLLPIHSNPTQSQVSIQHPAKTSAPLEVHTALSPVSSAPSCILFSFPWDLSLCDEHTVLLQWKVVLPSWPISSPLSHASLRKKVFLIQLAKLCSTILQARLQQYMNWELSDVQAGFRKGRGTRDQISNIHWITEKAREFQKNIYFCFIDYAKAFDCVDQTNWKILKEIGIPDHLTCLLRDL